MAPLFLSAGCVTAATEETNSVRTDGLVRSDGLLTKSLLNVSRETVLSARTVRIVPTQFSSTIGDTGMGTGQHALVANAVDRALCMALGERLQIVAGDGADITVRATVTRATPTNTAAAGLSQAASLAVPLLLPGTPVYVPRLPIGLGSLSVQADARDRRGRRAAAMMWERTADIITSSPRVSTDGDAYDLAGIFGADFASLLVTGESPFNGEPRLPFKEMAHALGIGPGVEACRAYGSPPGLKGLAGRRIGLPPDWTDQGAPIPGNAL
ncbi:MULTISPECIES: DUF3313 family protein [Methylobacterium]|uniref:DUF3313 family protein n=1 Tax=Methylobacterium TaxID=407 RepID=UPI001FAB76D8|nr:DUF3313 family protein [Methylobacterium sp. Leaf104]